MVQTIGVRGHLSTTARIGKESIKWDVRKYLCLIMTQVDIISDPGLDKYDARSPDCGATRSHSTGYLCRELPCVLIGCLSGSWRKGTQNESLGGAITYSGVRSEWRIRLCHIIKIKINLKSPRSSATCNSNEPSNLPLLHPHPR